MKIDLKSSGNVVAQNGVTASSTFDIARTPHMFRMLSSGLYSDKIGAVLREVGCNAFDAHVRVGKGDIPFEVKLPTKFDRSFWVKDNGPGLTKQELTENYTTYGWSDKQQKEDEIGGFGLGSKSPLAYTLENPDLSDGFTVESVKNGQKTIITCYINDEGVPAVSPVWEGPNDDPEWASGLRVLFPIQEGDIREFAEKALEVYRWFERPPTVHGLNAPITDVEFGMSGSFFKLAPKAPLYQRPAVIMGNVRYPITASHLRDLGEAEKALLNSGIHMWLPMGTVKMTPSREELEYIELTRNAVKTWLAKAAVEVGATLRDAVSNSHNLKYWQWAREIRMYFESLPTSLQFALERFLVAAGVEPTRATEIATVCRNASGVLPTWVGNGLEGFVRPKGVNALDWVSTVSPSELRGARVWHYYTAPGRGVGRTVRRQEVYYGKITVSRDKDEPLQLRFTDDVKVVYVDGKGAHGRVQALLRDTSNAHVLLVMPGRNADEAYVKSYAHKMASEAPLEGVELIGSMELHREATASRARPPKLDTVDAIRKHFSQEEVVFTTNKGVQRTIKLGDVPASGVFYLCGYDESRSSRNRSSRYFNAHNGTAIGCRQYYFSNVLSAIDKMARDREFEFKGVVLIKAEGAAKRLKFVEQGIQPLFPAIQAEVRLINRELGQVHGHASNEPDEDAPTGMPEFDFSSQQDCRRYGWVGTFAHISHKKKTLWKVVQDKFAGTDFLEYAKSQIEAIEKARKFRSSPTLTAIDVLAGYVDGISTPDCLSREYYYAYAPRFTKKFPEFNVLDENRMMQYADDDQESFIYSLEFAWNFCLRKKAQKASDESQKLAA